MKIDSNIGGLAMFVSFPQYCLSVWNLIYPFQVDGHTLLNERVGYTLKNGLEIAGRRFDFLAYSNSALREHAVWFVHPLYDPTTARFIDANEIRDGLGDFSELTRMPSKYAARLGQAFTATDPSVTITRDQWEEMDDLGSKPYLFTDGIGTISKGLGDLIWAALCRARGGNGKEEQDSNIVAIMTNSIQPSAVRFLLLNLPCTHDRRAVPNSFSR